MDQEDKITHLLCLYNLNNSCNNNSVNNNEEEFQEGKKENNLMDKDKEKNIKNNNKDNPNAFFCYDSSQNKKIIEFLIILNVVTISIVLYITSALLT